MIWVDYLPYIFTGAGILILLAALWAWVSVARDMRRNDERRRTDALDREMHEANIRDSWRPYFDERWRL